MADFDLHRELADRKGPQADGGMRNHRAESHDAGQTHWNLADLIHGALNKLPQVNPTDKTKHMVYMSFVFRNGWRCSFCDQDLTVIQRRLVFRRGEKVQKMARRGNGIANEIDRLCLLQQIADGRGGVWLKLNEDQYRALCQL